MGRPQALGGAAAVLLSVLASAGPAPAGEGVREINAACLAAGCFPGDAPGAPVEITAGGSYRLTGSISHSGFSEGSVVSIQADGVELDLNGFEISGAVSFKDGVRIGGAGDEVRDVTVRNGRVRAGAASTVAAIRATGASDVRLEDLRILGSGSGVLCGDACSVVGSVVRDNGSGVACGSGCRVLDSRVEANTTGPGIECGDGCTVRGCRVAANGSGAVEDGGGGITTGNGARVVDNLVEENAEGPGIATLGNARVAGNTVVDNGGPGIRALSGAVVEGNVVYRNDATGIRARGVIERNDVNRNLGDGIDADVGSVVRGNSIRSNSGCGLEPDGAGYGENTLFDNNFGDRQVGGSGTEIAPNACTPTADCTAGAAGGCS